MLNSDTTSGIQLKYGGGALGALKLDPLQKFLADHNRDPKQLEIAKDNFIKVYFAMLSEAGNSYFSVELCWILCRNICSWHWGSTQRQHYAHKRRPPLSYVTG